MSMELSSTKLIILIDTWKTDVQSDLTLRLWISGHRVTAAVTTTP